MLRQKGNLPTAADCARGKIYHVTVLNYTLKVDHGYNATADKLVARLKIEIVTFDSSCTPSAATKQNQCVCSSSTSDDREADTVTKTDDFILTALLVAQTESSWPRCAQLAAADRTLAGTTNAAQVRIMLDEFTHSHMYLLKSMS